MIILVVDDDTSLRTVLGMQLQHLGFETRSAESGLQAVQMFSNEKFDLIMMDVQMPYMDGLEATAEIRKKEAAEGFRRTPIVAVTANINKHMCIEAGMDDYLFKPVMLDDLKKTLSAWLGSPHET